MVDPSTEARSGATVPLLNLANVLTVARLVLIPVFLVVFFTGGGQDVLWRWIASGVFVLAAITDHVDGNIARSRGLVTDFGKIADPIADKALIGASLLGLCLVGDLPWWVLIVIGGREVGVTLLRFWVIRYGVIPASQGGKIKTLTQVVAIACYLAPMPDGFAAVRMTIMGIALVLTVATGVDYLVRAVRLRSRARRAKAAE